MVISHSNNKAIRSQNECTIIQKNNVKKISTLEEQLVILKKKKLIYLVEIIIEIISCVIMTGIFIYYAGTNTFHWLLFSLIFMFEIVLLYLYKKVRTKGVFLWLYQCNQLEEEINKIRESS